MDVTHSHRLGYCRHALERAPSRQHSDDSCRPPHGCLTFGNPGHELGHALLPALRCRKLERLGNRARVADVITLVAGAPVSEIDFYGPAEPRLDEAQNAFETDGIRRSAAEIESAAGDAPDFAPAGEIGFDGVGDVQHIAHLTPVAVNRDRLPAKRAVDKMRDPALILRAHLMRAIDAAHAQHRRQQIEASGIIQNVLIRGALGAAVGRVEVERPMLVDAVAAQARFYGQIALVVAFKLDIAQIAVHLVRAGKEKRRARIVEAQRFQERERTADIHVEIEAGFDQAGRHGDLCRKMENGPAIADRFTNRRPIPDIATGERDFVGVTTLQPFEIVLDAGTCERIEDEDRISFARQPIGKVDANKSGAAGDKDGTRREQRWRGGGHATSPLASSSRRASSTRSSASCCATHSASSARPTPKSSCATKPISCSAFPTAAKQCLMSPARSFPVISGARFSRFIACARPIATSSTVSDLPLPMLNTLPAAPGCSSAIRNARPTSFTCTKSRRCCPSSKTIGRSPFSRRDAKMASTPVYGLESAWPGP